MRLARILDLVYNAPWAITPEKHRVIRQLLDTYLEKKAFDIGDLAPDDSASFEIVGNTAIVPIEGVILGKASGLEMACGAFSLEALRQTLRDVAGFPDVANVVLNISSGGGTVTGTPEAAQAIKALGRIKNVLAYTDSCAASAAYWLACNASAVFLSQSAEIGSVGVYCAFLDESQAYAQEGLKVEVFKGGNSMFKAMGLPGTSLSEDQKAYLQASVDKTYSVFVATVKANRKRISEDALSGKMFDAEDAVKNGLADGIVSDVNSLIEYLNK